MDTLMFQGYSTFMITEQPMLCCPRQFNFCAINGLIVRFDLSYQSNGKKGKCFLFPVQITITKWHAKPKLEFFKNWSQWIKDLNDYDIEIVFLWISTKDLWERKVKLSPEYASNNVHICDVNQDTWERYSWALKLRCGRGQANVTAVISQKRALKKQGMLEEPETVGKDASSSDFKGVPVVKQYRTKIII